MLRVGASVLAALTLASCQSGSSGHPGVLATNTPSPKANATASLASTPHDAQTPAPPSAFEGIDWTRLTVPGNACFSPTAIHLKSAPFLDVDSNGEEAWVPLGQAFIPSPMGNAKDHHGDGPRYVELTNAPTEIKYGQLGTHGQIPVATVPLTCTNNGGTAAGQLLFSVAGYTVTNGHLKLLRLITPQQEPRESSHVTLIQVGRISSDGVTVNEAWYGPNDADCCATGEAISLWKYEAGTLRHVGTRVTRRPK